MSYPPPNPLYLGPALKTMTGNNQPISRVVLHGTVSATVAGGARATAAYFKTPAAGGSAHYVVDPAEVVQVVYDSVIAEHAPPNPHSLGVELCDPVGDKAGKPLPLSRWSDQAHTEMLSRAAALVAQLCLAYNVPVRLVGPLGLRAGRGGICEHSDVSEAWHQSSHWDLGNFPRRRFLKLVRAEVAATKAGGVIPATTHLRPSRITKARDLLEAAYRTTRSKVRQARIQRALDQLPER